MRAPVNEFQLPKDPSSKAADPFRTGTPTLSCVVPVGPAETELVADPSLVRALDEARPFELAEEVSRYLQRTANAEWCNLLLADYAEQALEPVPISRDQPAVRGAGDLDERWLAALDESATEGGQRIPPIHTVVDLSAAVRTRSSDQAVANKLETACGSISLASLTFASPCASVIGEPPIASERLAEIGVRSTSRGPDFRDNLNAGRADPVQRDRLEGHPVLPPAQSTLTACSGHRAQLLRVDLVKLYFARHLRTGHGL